jgi:hypothetical protein
MSVLVGQHQVTTFVTPTNGTSPIDANQVKANDNAVIAGYNPHDSDGTIHVQSSTLAARPAAGTAGRYWVTSDGLRLYLDSGSAWQEVAYVNLIGGQSIAGTTTLSALGVTANAIVGTTFYVGGVATFAGGQRSGSGSVSSPNNATTALFTPPSIPGMYIVGAYLSTAAANSAAYHVFFYNGTTLFAFVNQSSTNMALVVSGGAICGNQSSGSTQNINYVYTFLPT